MILFYVLRSLTWTLPSSSPFLLPFLCSRRYDTAERYGEARICGKLFCSGAEQCWFEEPRSGDPPHNPDHYRFMRLDHDSGMWVKVCFECESARATRWCEQCEDPHVFSTTIR